MRAGRACDSGIWCGRFRDELAECVACCSAPLLPCADPRERAGLYWGYTTRIVPSLAALLDPAQCPFEGGYDLTVGTSGVLALQGVMFLCALSAACAMVGMRAAVRACVANAAHPTPPSCLLCLPRFAERGEQAPPCELRLAPARHMLVVFGGPQVRSCCPAGQLYLRHWC